MLNYELTILQFLWLAVIQNTLWLNNIYNLKKVQLNYKTKMFNELTVIFFIGSFEYIKVW